MKLRIFTLNTNKIKTQSKLSCLDYFIVKFGCDVIFLQDVDDISIGDIEGYQCLWNFPEDNKGGTAVMFKNCLVPYVSDHSFLVDGRGLGFSMFNFRFVNIFAPAGVDKNKKSEFFKFAVDNLVREQDDALIIGGDFKCVLREEDQFPSTNICLPLQELFKQIQVTDTWEIFSQKNQGFTYVCSSYKSREDRFYISSKYINRITFTHVYPVSFSDHCAYTIDVNISNDVRYLKGMWKRNFEEEEKARVVEALSKRMGDDFPTDKISNYLTSRDNGDQFVTKIISSFYIYLNEIRKFEQFNYGRLYHLYFWDNYLNCQKNIKRIKDEIMRFQMDRINVFFNIGNIDDVFLKSFALQLYQE